MSNSDNSLNEIHLRQQKHASKVATATSSARAAVAEPAFKFGFFWWLCPSASKCALIWSKQTAKIVSEREWEAVSRGVGRVYVCVAV